jgi:hypothetical protein
MQTHNSSNGDLSTLIDSLPTRSKIFLPTDKVPHKEQLSGLKRVKRLYSEESRAEYSDRLRNLKTGLGARKRCFIIGNGPSLNQTDLSLLDNEITFALNGFFLKADSLNWTPTFYVVEDHLVAEDRAEQIQNFKGPIKFFPIYLGYCLPESDDTIFYNHRPRVSYPDGFDFSLKADEITYTGCTVTFSALQLAAYLGFTEIYLIGVDADYKIPEEVKNNQAYDTSVLDMETDDPNHFHPDYFGKGYRWHDPQVNKMMEAYSEARKVCDENGISIRNATIGGKLEIFERTNYLSLFSSEEQRGEKNGISTLPKLLLIDFTRMGHHTATGELKQAYFSTWSKDKILHLYGEVGSNFGLVSNGNDSGNCLSDKDVITNVLKYQPEVILYRPVENRPDLHVLAMRLIADLKRPYMIWLMDDWPQSLRVSDPIAANASDKDLAKLCSQANKCMAISEPMAGAFGARYGQPFDVYHNAVDHKIWEAIAPTALEKGAPQNGELIIRYSGNLSPNLTLDTLLELAEVVESMSLAQNICLQIHTQPHWKRNTAHHFDTFSRTSVSVTDLDTSEYYSWLAGADILFIGNNFGEYTQHYLQYSFANKIVEFLASGLPIIAYGPEGLYSMDFLETTKGVIRVREQSKTALENAIKTLAASPKKMCSLGQQNRHFAFSNFSLAKKRTDFQNSIIQTAEAEFRGFTYTYPPKRAITFSKYVLQNKQLRSVAAFPVRVLRRAARFVKRGLRFGMRCLRFLKRVLTAKN